MLQEDTKVQEVYQDRRRSNENMREERGIDLAKITRKQTVLYSMISYIVWIDSMPCAPWR